MYLAPKRCEPEALLMGALGGLVYFMSICVDAPVKIGVGVFSNQQNGGTLQLHPT